MVLAVCYGVTFSIIPLAYAGVTIFKAFAATMGMFAAMSFDPRLIWDARKTE